MGPAERVVVVGGTASSREQFTTELRQAGYETDERPGLLEYADGVQLIIIAGGAESSRRDGFGAVVDAVTAARKAAGSAAVIACVPRGAGAEAIDASLNSGADDILICPPAAGALLSRVRAGLRSAAARVTAERFQRYAEALTRIGDSVGHTLEPLAGLHEILARLCETVNWHRAVLLVRGDLPEVLWLVAASDEPLTMKVPIELERYPEVRACLVAQEPVLVEDAQSSALLGQWAEVAAEKGGRSLLALPLLIERKPVGVILLRAQAPRATLGLRGLEFLRLASTITSLVLRSSRVFESLREQTRRLPLAHYNEERRSRALEKYRDFFEASSDGMVVVDASGTVLYVNRAAEQITGYAREGLRERHITDIVPAAQRSDLRAILFKMVAGTNLEAFDLQLTTTSGENLTVSVASSSVLAEHQCAILAFRDVTEARALEDELRKTKDFLERLIDSTLDGIIACDMRGQVIIFNQGASRLYGYPPEEVIGKLPVWRLYPEGVANLVMAELRAPEHGGIGRLEPSRRDIVTRDGELVPVSLTASIIYEEGREVASVGIISDLRERLKMEHRLAQAQEKLMVTEKQALIAELAGTTAHELNQPLTSVVGYSELLKKKMTPEDPHYRAIDIILREAERMAEIVRKIGRITRYETKTYVGSTQILDLDKSTTDG